MIKWNYNITLSQKKRHPDDKLLQNIAQLLMNTMLQKKQLQEGFGDG